MEELKIQHEASYKTPKVEYYPEDRKLLIEGRLIPEDPLSFFADLELWLEKFRQVEQTELNIELFLFYYNTSSLKRMVDFLDSLKGLKNYGKEVKLTWKCDEGDEDNLADGKDFQKDFLPYFEIDVVEV